jgi:hypothetical protein
MADYFEHHDRRADRFSARVHPRAHGDHTGVVLTGLAILMLGVLALLWSSQETVVSRLPQPTAALSQPSFAAPVAAQAPAAPAPLAMRAAPAARPPASYAVAAAGDTRAVQP